MRRFIGSAAALACGLFSAGALADDQGQITIFGQLYNVQRFDYSAQLAYQDPSDCNSSGTINLVMSEGIAFAGNNHAYMCSRDMDIFNTYKHQVIEVQFNTDGTGKITGLSFVRSVVRNDTSPTGDPNNCGLGSPFGLNARGLAINTGPTGLGAHGNLIAFSGNEVVHGYDINTGMYLPNGADFNNGWSTNPPNGNCDDGTYVPSKNEFYTLDQSPPSFVRFTPKGALVSSFSVGSAVTSEPAGDPKGIFYCQDVATFPTLFHGKGGVVIAVLDELGPAVQAFDLNGTLIKHEVLSLDASPGILQLESGTSDPSTGRIFLVNQDTAFVDDFIWILTPVNPPVCPHSSLSCVTSDIFPAGSGDCQVNLSDLGVVLSNYQPGVPGKSRAQGDIFPLGGDSVVDLSDLGQILSDFGADCR